MKDKKEMDKKGAIFIPAGLLIGFGVGFLTDNIPAGMFIGLGIGFAVFGISLFFER